MCPDAGAPRSSALVAALGGATVVAALAAGGLALGGLAAFALGTLFALFALFALGRPRARARRLLDDRGGDDRLLGVDLGGDAARQGEVADPDGVADVERGDVDA